MSVSTILIYDQCGEANIQFTVLPGDLSHLHDTYINKACGQDDDVKAKQDELCDLLFTEDGHGRIKRWVTKFPAKFMAEHPDTKVIVVGFLP